MPLLKSWLRNLLLQFNKLIARYWIAPFDTLLWEIVGLSPSSPQYSFRTAVVWLRDLGRLIYSGFRVNISRWDDPAWSVIYISDSNSVSEKELQHLLFSEAPLETNLGRIFIWQVPAKIKTFAAEGLLIVCDVNRLVKWQFQDLQYVRIFPRLRSLLDVSIPMEGILKRMTRHRRQDIGKVKARNFDYRVSRNVADFELFYHQMHHPLITARYQDRALLSTYIGQRELFEKRGQLLCVNYQGSFVAALLGTIRRYGRTFSALHLGLHQGHAELMEQGMIVALYWHTINWAHQQNLSWVDFGWVRARLTDGLFLFKHRWGMRFEPDVTEFTIWTLIGKQLPAALLRHLNDLAFITQVGHEYRVVVFDGNNEAKLSADEIAQREKIMAQAGLDGFLILPSPCSSSEPIGLMNVYEQN